MRPCELAERRVGLLGYGREGRATHAALERATACASIVVLEDAPAPSGCALQWLTGDAALEALRNLDAVVASPGVPPRHPILLAARERGLTITTATNLFLAECAHEDVPVTAVTGSKGKSTTSTLLHASLVESGREAALLGNVGAPALDALDDVIARRALVVFEMSSYQAALLDASVEIAVITELFPEHLDWHGGTERYYSDKLRLPALQQPEGLTIWNGSSDELRRRAPLGPARHEAYAVAEGVTFSDGLFLRQGSALFSDAEMLLRGAHNRRNACAVLTATAALGVPDDAVRETLSRFAGLPHRLEDLGVQAGLQWINDSISTAPEAAVAAIESYSGEAMALIAGGHDRGYDFASLASAVNAAGVATVAVLPPSGLALASALREAGYAGALYEASDLAGAVAWTAATAKRGVVVLFSPASPSYGSFRNFEERGARFRELVARLGC